MFVYTNCQSPEVERVVSCNRFTRVRVYCTVCTPVQAVPPVRFTRVRRRPSAFFFFFFLFPARSFGKDALVQKHDAGIEQ
jgi:hypothetical protein